MKGRGLALGALLASVAAAGLSRRTGRVLAREGDARSARAAVRCRREVAPDSPGAVVAVVRSGAVVFEQTLGLADVNSSTPMTTGAVFDLASVSKPFTACLILRLVEQGRLGLDEDVRGFLPELPVAGRTRPIHVRDLLAGTTGLADYQNLVESYDGLTSEKIVGLAGAANLTFAPGARYVDSNTNYALLAALAARVKGRSFGELLRGEILEPCGMRRTVVLERKDQAIPGRVFGYARADGRWRLDTEDTPGIVGDGGLFSCAADLVLFERALREGKVLAARSLALAFNSGRLDSGEETHHGYGWALETRGGHRMASRSGAWGGTSAYYGRALDTDLAVIVLRNQGDWDASKLGEALEAIFLEGS